jgi:Xaa-Pro aminopeptidase
MAGTPEGPPQKGIPEKIREVMVRFDVDEKTARLLLSCSVIIASETFAKWKSNTRRMQMLKAREILELIKKAQNGDSKALAEAESKLQSIIETRSWER